MIAVRLSRSDSPSSDASAYTDNVSLHGARAVSKSRWQVGERADIEYLREGSSMRGEVVYCQSLGDSFYVGFKFEEPITWSPLARYQPYEASPMQSHDLPKVASALAALSDNTPVSYYNSTVWNGYAHQPAAEIVGVPTAQTPFSVSGAGITSDIDTASIPIIPPSRASSCRGSRTRGPNRTSQPGPVNNSLL
jgi:hypothetical protein